LKATEDFWLDWASRCRSDKLTNDASVPAHWIAAIRRSLITLKALTYAPTGGIVAAPTTSLPEWIGGRAQLGLSLLLAARFRHHPPSPPERRLPGRGAGWRDWLVRALAGNVEQIQIMYGLAGERRLQEWQADWLPGFAAPGPFGSATPPTISSSSTSTAR
jgi:hypothetical protein